MHHGPTAQSWYPKKSKGISVHPVFRARDRDVMLWKKCPPKEKDPNVANPTARIGPPASRGKVAPPAAKVALIVTGVQTLVYQCIRYYSKEV